MSEKTWPECLRCGGSTTGKLYDTTCSHDFGPEPASVIHAILNRERYYAALGMPGPGGEDLSWSERVAHPTREGAIAGWREQVRAKARLVDALFGRLTAWAREGAEMEAAKPARVVLNAKEQAIADVFEQIGVRVSVRETGGVLPITVEATRGSEQLALVVGSRQRVIAMLHQAFERVATATDHT